MIRMQVAAQQFGDSAAPFIEKGSEAISKLSGWLNSLDDGQREKLIHVGIALAAIGPALSIAGKSISVFAGLKNLFGSAGAGAATASKSMGGLLGTVLALPGPVKIAGAAIAGVTAAVWVGTKAYDAYKKSQSAWVDDLATHASSAAESANKVRELSKLQYEVRDLKLVIASEESSQDQINTAKNRLEEIKKLLGEEYNFTVTCDTKDLDTAIEKLTKIEASRTREELNNYRTDLTQTEGDYGEAKKKYSDAASNYNTAVDRQTFYTKAGEQLSTLTRQMHDGQLSAEQYEEKVRDVGRQYLKFVPDGARAEDVISDIAQAQEHATEEAENFDHQMDEQTAIIDKYEQNAKKAADAALNLIAYDATNGLDFSDDVDTVAKVVKSAGLNIYEYTQKIATAQGGVASLSEAWRVGGDTLDKVVAGYINAGSKMGMSSNEIAQGAALIKNGFTNIEDASAAGKLDAVSQDMTKIAREMGQLDRDHRIQLTAGGDIQIIDETTDKITEIDGKDVDVKVNADGNIDVVNEAGESVKELDGKAASIEINADGNYNVLDEAKKKIGEIDGETGEVIVTVVDESSDIIAGTEESLSDLDGQEVDFSVNADGTQAYATIGGVQYLVMAYDATTGNALLSADGTQASLVVNTATDQVSGFSNERGTATLDADDLASGKAQSAATAISNIKDKTVSIKAVFSAVGNAVKSWFGFAKGTRSAPGGPAIVNDERGIADPRELIVSDGQAYIPEGRDVPVWLKPGDQVYPARQTRRLLEGMGVPHYASGKNNETAFDKAKKTFEHRKKTSEVSIADELAWWIYARDSIKLVEDEAAEVAEEIYKLTKDLSEDIVKTAQDADKERKEDSDRWIERQKKYNHMSVEEEQAAYQRVIDYHQESLAAILADERVSAEDKEKIWKEYTKEIEDYGDKIYDAARENAERILELAQETREKLNEDSENWIDLHDFYEDWGEFDDTKLDALNRTRSRGYQEMMNAIAEVDEMYWLSDEEKQAERDERWEEGNAYLADLDKELYTERKRILDESVNTYIEGKRKELEADRKARKEKLEAEQEAVNKKYDNLDEKDDQADRDKKRAEYEGIARKYRDSATREGRQKYKDAMDELADLDAEEEHQRREKQKEAELDAIDKRMDAADEKYDRLEEQLADREEKLLGATKKWAKLNETELSNFAMTTADTVTQIYADYAEQQQAYLDQSLKTFDIYLYEISRRLDKFQAAAGGTVQLPNKTPEVVVNLDGSQGVGDTTVTYNNYGDQHFEGDADVERSLASVLDLAKVPRL